MTPDRTSDATWIVLLRGINVGGHRKVPMAELRRLCGALGFDGAATYIQSGNVVFRGSGSEKDVARRITDGIAAHFGFHVPVVVRSVGAMERIVASNPFLTPGHDPATLHVGFLSGSPSPSTVDGLPPQPPGPEEFRVMRAEVYLRYPDGMGRSKLTGSWFERGLGVDMTVRNWRTVNRLVEMAREA